MGKADQLSSQIALSSLQVHAIVRPEIDQYQSRLGADILVSILLHYFSLLV